MTIGESPDSSVKCVASQPGVYCDDTAEQVGRTGQWPDTFHIYEENNQICAKRTDADAGWGLNLVLHCKSYDAGAGEYYRTSKIRYCCKHELFSKACPYDCSSIPQISSEKRRGWCCRNRAMHCHANERPPPAQTGPSGPVDCSEPDTTESHAPLPDQQGGGGWNPNAVGGHPRYDCLTGTQEMWSQDKAQYCRLWLAAFHSNEALFDCSDGEESSWSVAKTRWCSTHSTGPHECDRKKSDEWDHRERDFCCIVKGIGCPKEKVTPLENGHQIFGNAGRNSWENAASLDIIDTPSTKPAPGVVHHELHFDCLAKDREDWSETQKRWCCSKWGLYCEELGAFNCSSGFWNWRKGWSSHKKDYCCKKEGKGCEDKTYDCTQESTASNKEAREWCCDNHLYSKACPFDCHAGLDKWVVGFAPAKKSWCCKYEKLACGPPTHHHVGHLAGGLFSHGVRHSTLERPLKKPHFRSQKPMHAQIGHASERKYTFADCQNKNDRPRDVVSWCCSNLGLCYLKISFNCKAGLHSWHTWSDQKQAMCCGKKVTCPADGSHRQGASRFGAGGMHGHMEHFSEQSGSHTVWFHDRDVENVHIGASPESGTKCVTPSKPVSCPIDAGNRREDNFPDRFKVYRKGGQLCVERLDYKHLWGLDLVLKCIKADSHRFQQVYIGSSPTSRMCVPQTSPVTCEDDAAQAGRTDPHPDTFQVYHSRGQICAKRTDAHSHWGVNLVLYCRKGGWDSGFWSTSGGRVLEDSFSQDVKDPGARSPVEHPSWPMLAILPGFAAVLLGALFYSAPCRRNPSDALLLQADPEDANSNERKARTPWLSVPPGDEGDELEVA